MTSLIFQNNWTKVHQHEIRSVKCVFWNCYLIHHLKAHKFVGNGNGTLKEKGDDQVVDHYLR